MNRKNWLGLFVGGFSVMAVGSAYALEDQKIKVGISLNSFDYARATFWDEGGKSYAPHEYAVVDEAAADLLASLQVPANSGKRYECRGKLSGNAVLAPPSAKRVSGIVSIFSLHDCVGVNERFSE